MTWITSTSERPRVIAVIGGGFSGVMVAIHLLRQLPASATRVVLVERNKSVGSGVAFARSSFPYLLNVPAARMSAFPEHAAHLIDFVRRFLPEVTAESFLPRQLYGEYLRDVLSSAQAAAPAAVRLEQMQGEATAIQSMSSDGPMIVSVGPRQFLADQVVLACGDPAPVPKPYAADLIRHPAYVLDPYVEECVHPNDRAVLLIGTGLTMTDVAVRAAEQNPAVSIVALSRHGLLPQRQNEGAATVLPESLQLANRLVGVPLRVAVRAARELATSVQDLGGDWREAIGRVREIMPQIWQGLDVVDRRRFLRHVRVYWDVHRHRMPPAVADRIAQLQSMGRLKVLAGRVTQLCADGERIVALWKPRGRYETRELWMDRVVECSGSDGRLQQPSDALWKQLIADGLATPDATGIGVRTCRFGALLDVHGRASGRIFYLGPMLRAAHWEATAVGELRQLAQALATALARAGHPSWREAAPVGASPKASMRKLMTR